MIIKIISKSTSPAKISEETVNSIWNLDKFKNKYLYDGEIFYISSFHENLIYGDFIGYKYFYAQNKLGDFGLRTLAIAAVIRCHDGILLVKRGEYVTQDKGLWELSISGGIERFCAIGGKVDPEIQIKKEIFEELGIEGRHIKSLDYLGYIYDSSISYVVDLVYKIDVDLSAPDIKKIYNKTKNEESTEILIFELTKLNEFIERNIKSISPTSISINNFISNQKEFI